MGDKAAARRAADRAGVPIVPGTTEPVDDPTRPRRTRSGSATRSLVKAAFGGGGQGMHVVRGAERARARPPARGARGASRTSVGPEVYLERYLERAHHVEVQILADAHGNVHLPRASATARSSAATRS